MSGVVPITGYAARLTAGADSVDEARARLKLAIRQRNEIIWDAVDDGFPQSAAAKHARVSQPHIVRVMAQSYEDVADLVA